MHHIDAIKETQLWKTMVRKADEEKRSSGFVPAVEQVCTDALGILKTTILFFPTFTLHDGTHSVNVCEWMDELLGKKGLKKLTAQEAALLLMAACCHDLGMCVNKDQKKALKAELREQLKVPFSDEWYQFFLENQGEYTKYKKKKAISDGMLRYYVRRHHHERVGKVLSAVEWKEKELGGNRFYKPALLELCRSHGEDLGNLKEEGNFDLRFLAIILRLADLLDYDGSRVPQALYRFAGLNEPKDEEENKSLTERAKNAVGRFEKPEKSDQPIPWDTILYTGLFDSPNLEHEVRRYLDWGQKELDACHEHLKKCGRRWDGFSLPWTIQNLAKGTTYTSAKFSMTMDQDRVIELLAGKDLYSSPGVFVRELLQNAIDAVRMRAQTDRDFNEKMGLVEIDTWPAENGDTWFRIRDNGVGMDEHIIENYFLKVGRSYYGSAEFRLANDQSKRKTPYTAISRFGIGLLSCFLEDPDGTELYVSTKRFGQKKENGVRLDVKGLHGYYYILQQKDYKEMKPGFLQMPSPNGKDKGYRTKAGTTICLRTNLARAGCTKSFRELLDQYVKFPEVRVTFNGFSYPTQQDLMELAYKMNPDGKIKAYEHEITDEQFQELQKTAPEVTWTKKPVIVARYTPLDMRSGDPNLTGLELSFETRCEGTLFNTGIVQRSIKPEFLLKDREKLVVRFRKGSYSDDKREGDRKFALMLTGENSILEGDEQKLFNYLLQSGLLRSGAHHLVAYNGVLAGRSNISRRSDSIVLLRGAFRPEVGLSREEIRSLPPEAACCYAMTFEVEGEVDPKFLAEAAETRLLTRRQLREYIRAHEGWQEKLEQRLRYHSHLGEKIFSVNKMYGRLLLSSLDQDDVSTLDFNSRDGLTKAKRMEESAYPMKELDDFPAAMFFQPENDVSELYTRVSLRYAYNVQHEFSRWLIGHREALAEKAPALYDRMIRFLVLGTEWSAIRDEVNAILRQLKCMQDDIFGIGDLKLV